jgi:hypothetical protein
LELPDDYRKRCTTSDIEDQEFVADTDHNYEFQQKVAHIYSKYIKILRHLTADEGGITDEINAFHMRFYMNRMNEAVKYMKHVHSKELSIPFHREGNIQKIPQEMRQQLWSGSFFFLLGGGGGEITETL